MKGVLGILSLLISLSTFANMGNPVQEGNVSGSPFVNEYVDILNEDIYIKLKEEFLGAYFDINYQVYSDSNGINIPFLFYAYEYADNFNIYVDGVRIETSLLPIDLQERVTNEFVDFDYLFSNDHENDIHFMIDESTGYSLDFEDMIYFTTDLTAGDHTIRITYDATHWNDQTDWVCAYSIRYSLTPAKYWKSFGSLTISIDQGDFDDKYSTNLGPHFSKDSETVITWKFSKLPVDVVLIKFDPEISKSASFFIKLSPFGLANVIGLILAVIHFYLIKKYRINNPESRFSTLLLLGGFLVPVLYILIWYNSFAFIDYLIGPHASREHGYYFVIFILLPFVLATYWVAIWLTDKLYFRPKANLKQLHQKDSEEDSVI